ncbi:2-C-methyl-D-erythritol 4-phosphate cytidylyltransferase [Chitinivibrio alkaliphilus]|uniref:2-C-methyl-D-erythritol 4-phosphate cytidylyltransferase n=1 Tax=Chitinivibrio alkaliphilus ACht1 TaxID=1313304 RepID=U7D944_9BACT|nr:2-C-methyl-D-erythritol 4-phosphate cytidylyltransferase [Chitinivibrio alkaliphilus]ERP31617.1 2-C-methyl-D-erythritol 4-phosphate cytidylyltransferase [Chitinivibrio alkaliphilus ACht1]
MSTMTAILVAGGMGTRLGEPIPKAFVPLGKKPLFLHAFRVFDEYPAVSAIRLIVPAGYEAAAEEYLQEHAFHTPHLILPGGEQRWESVRIGVESAETELVCIHDAARPFVSAQVMEELSNNLGEDAGVITVNRVTDTVRTFSGQYCGTTVNRDSLISVGTPQLFRRQVLLSCYAKVDREKSLPTDEAMLLEQQGIPVRFSYGDPRNFKVTTPAEYTMAQALLSWEEA